MSSRRARKPATEAMASTRFGAVCAPLQWNRYCCIPMQMSVASVDSVADCWSLSLGIRCVAAAGDVSASLAQLSLGQRQFVLDDHRARCACIPSWQLNLIWQTPLTDIRPIRRLDVIYLNVQQSIEFIRSTCLSKPCIYNSLEFCIN